MMDITSREAKYDPFPIYARMRATMPMAHIPAANTWQVFRYDDVKVVLSDRERFSSAVHRYAPDSPLIKVVPERNLLWSDPPLHSNMRGLVAQAFTPRLIAGLQPQIEQIVDSLLDGVIEAGRLDVVDDFATPLAAMVVGILLGFPVENYLQLKRWASAMLESWDDLFSGKEPVDTTVDLRAFVEGVIAARRAEPRDDMISKLLGAEVDGDRLSTADLTYFCTILLFGGLETTVNLVASTVRCLLEAPDQMDRLRANPALVASAVEEVMRYRSPFQIEFRWATHDLSFAGVSIRKGQMLAAFIGSANRDESAFPDGERFDIARQPNHHLGLGSGIHYCLGAPLARMEGQIALRKIMERLPGLARSDDAPLAPCLGAPVSHGVAHLPVSFTPGKRVRRIE